MKRCPTCDTFKSWDAFHRDRSRGDGVTALCKECRSRTHRNWYEQNRDKIALQQRTYRRHRPWERIRESWERSQAKYPERRAARKALQGARRRGRIVPPVACERCGDIPESPLHGHHADYSKPFEVEWLCRVCHGVEHREYKAAA